MFKFICTVNQFFKLSIYICFGQTDSNIFFFFATFEPFCFLSRLNKRGIIIILYFYCSFRNKIICCKYRKNNDNIELSILSMGMSGDYTVAVEEGAGYVRVGSSIFGLRDYSKL